MNPESNSEHSALAPRYDLSLPPLPPAAFDLQDKVYALHCSEGPIPKATAEALQGFLGKELRPWELDWQGEALGFPARAREAAAALLQAEVEDISLMASTSGGLQAIALGFPWQEGDEILVPMGEFPSNAYPWKALAPRGVTFREVRLWTGHRAGGEALTSAAPAVESDTEARILAAISRKTKVLALSWVRFQDGLKLDLARLGQACRDRGVHMVVDGIQGAGTHVPDLRWASAFATGSHKGLLAPQGSGFLWTSQELRSQLQPSGTWLGVEDGNNFARPSTDFKREWLTDGRCLEPGGPAVMMALGLATSLRTILEAGVARIADHIGALQGRFLEGLAGLPEWRSEALRLEQLRAADRLGPILALHSRNDGQAALISLMQKGFRRGICSSVREGYLRIAFHGWHGGTDVDRLLAWLSGTAS